MTPPSNGHENRQRLKREQVGVARRARFGRVEGFRPSRSRRSFRRTWRRRFRCTRRRYGEDKLSLLETKHLVAEKTGSLDAVKPFAVRPKDKLADVVRTAKASIARDVQSHVKE